MTLSGAAAAIFDAEGRVLLVKENYGRRRYGFPGGAVASGEAAEQAVLRELKEEAGIDAAVGHLIGLYRLDGGRSVHLFRCRMIGGTLEPAETGEIATARV